MLITAAVRVLGDCRCRLVTKIAVKISRVGQRNHHLRCPATSRPRETKTEHTQPSGEPEQKLRTKVQCCLGFSLHRRRADICISQNRKFDGVQVATIQAECRHWRGIHADFPWGFCLPCIESVRGPLISLEVRIVACGSYDTGHSNWCRKKPFRVPFSKGYLWARHVSPPNPLMTSSTGSV